MEKSFQTFWEDLSDQEKDLVIAMGTESKFPHRPKEYEAPKVGDKFVMPKTREELPEQARGLWDILHS